MLWSELPPSQPQSGTARSFGQVAQTVTLIGRFRSRAQRRIVSFGQCFVEPVVRQSTHGHRYWSVLEEANSDFLDLHGYYGKSTRVATLKPDSKTLPVAKRSGWACLKAAAANKVALAVDIPQTGDKKSPTLAVSGTADARKSPAVLSRSPRRSDAGLGQDGIVGQSIASHVPARFMSRCSPCPSTQHPIVRPHPESGVDSQPVQQVIPTIEINNNESRQVRTLIYCKTLFFSPHLNFAISLCRKFAAF